MTKTDLTTAIRTIDETASKAMELFNAADSFERELAVAQAMSDLRAALTPEVMKPIMGLMNSPIGFMTDRNPLTSEKPVTPYSMDVVRDCFIESKFRGMHAVGNEWNIIAGRFYAAKNGLVRLVKQFPGISEVRYSYDVPRNVGDKGAIVKCSASWKLNGKKDDIACEIPVRINAYMGTDAIIGKAERKLNARILTQLTGRGIEAAEPEEAIDVQTAPVTEPPSEPKFTRAKPPELEPCNDVQGELNEILFKEGINFDQFKEFCLDQGHFTEADNIRGYSDLAPEKAQWFIERIKPIVRNIKATKTQKEGLL